MGAEIGGAYAAGVSLHELEEDWRATSVRRAVKTLFPTIPWSGWTSGAEVVRSLRRLIGTPRIEHLETPFAAVATDLETGLPYVMQRGSLVDAIRASLSVPGLFTPVWFDDHLLIDGGVSNPLPIDVARGLGAEVVIAVDVLVEPSSVRMTGIPSIAAKERLLGIVKGPQPSSNGSARHYHPSVFAVLFQMSTVFQKRLCNVMLDLHPPDVLIRPDFEPDPPCYTNVASGIEAGEAATEAVLPAILSAVERPANAA